MGKRALIFLNIFLAGQSVLATPLLLSPILSFFVFFCLFLSGFESRESGFELHLSSSHCTVRSICFKLLHQVTCFSFMLFLTVSRYQLRNTPTGIESVICYKCWSNRILILFKCGSYPDPLELCRFFSSFHPRRLL